MTALFGILIALLLDKVFGEPRRFHPLVGFGRFVHGLEKRLNPNDPTRGRTGGILGLVLAVAPFSLSAAWLEWRLQPWPVWQALVLAVGLYLAIGWQSLLQHARDVAEPLRRKELDRARQAVAMLVSRDVDDLSEEGIARATTESVLENGADAVFSALFWWLVAGLPGVVLYRLVNTLDATWGYRNERYQRFGWAAARLDDFMNIIPARLTALGYALVGRTTMALRCWRTQAPFWKSPNAGPVMAAGAGALGVTLVEKPGIINDCKPAPGSARSR